MLAASASPITRLTSFVSFEETHYFFGDTFCFLYMLVFSQYGGVIREKDVFNCGHLSLRVFLVSSLHHARVARQVRDADPIIYSSIFSASHANLMEDIE